MLDCGTMQTARENVVSIFASLPKPIRIEVVPTLADEIVPRTSRTTTESRLKDRQFGILVVLGFSDTWVRGSRLLRCLCLNCGKTVERSSGALRVVKSCGCLRESLISDAQRTHGLSGSRLHRIWNAMKARCLNPNNKSYKNYGGRGIRIYESWLVFENFKAAVGAPPSDEHTLDRYPNQDGNYEPGNVRWATRTEQNRNSRKNRYLTVGDQTLCIGEWAEQTGKNKNTIEKRKRLGWTDEEAVLTPVNVSLSSSGRGGLHD